MASTSEGLGEVLTRQYRLSCELFNTFPQPHFTRQLSRAIVELHLSTVDLDHLEALCHTIKNKVSPSHLRIYVPMDKLVDGRVVERAVEGVAVCLVASLTITSLALEGVRLRGKTLKLLCEGVRKARTLKALHLEKCNLGDAGTESVCQAIKNVPSITHLSLVDCGVAERGATAIACLIKHQRLNRDSAMWQDTLRQRQPFLDGMKGLRRLTLNNNPALGDEGTSAIAEVLTEDLWIKAMDLQHCGLGVKGGASLCALLHANQTLEVLDARNNPFMPDKVLTDLTHLLQGRQTEASPQYTWLKATQEEEEALEEQQKVGNSVGYRTSGRAVKGRRGPKPPRIASSRRPKVPSQLGVPWRVEHRLYERREGLTPGSMVKEYCGLQQQQQSTEPATQPHGESSSDGDVTMMKMKRKLQHYRKKYRKEREHRQKLERKLSRIQTQLKGLHTLDEDTITHIEECFFKFQILLSSMQNSGEHLHASSGAASPLPHPSQADSFHILPGNNLPPRTFFPDPPSTVPVPVLFQKPLDTISLSHPVPISPDNLQRSHHDTKKLKQSEFSSQNREGTLNLNPLTPEGSPGSQGHLYNGDNSESKEGDLILESVASHQHINNLPVPRPHDALDGRNNRDEDMTKQEQISKKRLDKVKGKQRKEGIRSSEENNSMSSNSSPRSVKQKQTVGTQVTSDIIEWDIAQVKNGTINPEANSPTTRDIYAMRAEIEDYNEKLKIRKTNNINENQNSDVKEGGEHRMNLQSENLSLKNNVMKEISSQNDQKYTGDNSPEEINHTQKASLFTKRSSGSEGSQTQNSQSLREHQSLDSSQSVQANHLIQSREPPQTSQSLENNPSHQPIQLQQGSHLLHNIQSYSCQSPFKNKPVKECQLPQLSSTSLRQSPQPIEAYKNKSPRNQSSPSQSSLSQSPPSQSPHRQSTQSQSLHRQSSHSQTPQETYSPKGNQLHLKQASQRLSSSQALHAVDSPQESHQSPKKKSPKKCRSPREELGVELQTSEVSETDDEKMRNLNVWLHGRMRGRTSTPSSSSSLSISEQLQQSHCSWTKGQGHRLERGKEVKELPNRREVEEVHGESEFEFDASDLEDLSISGITLTNTSVPEDLHTPGEEDF